LLKPNKFPKTGLDHLLDVVDEIKQFIAKFKKSTKDRAAEVMRKLELCRNPLYHPGSLIFQKHQSEKLAVDSDDELTTEVPVEQELFPLPDLVGKNGCDDENVEKDSARK
jgi:hypothetical protein